MVLQRLFATKILITILIINHLNDQLKFSIAGRTLLWVAILGIAIVYIFALAAFALLRGHMDPDGEQSLYCQSLWQCLVTMIRYGFIGELFEVINYTCTYILSCAREVESPANPGRIRYPTL